MIFDHLPSLVGQTTYGIVKINNAVSFLSGIQNTTGSWGLALTAPEKSKQVDQRNIVIRDVHLNDAQQIAGIFNQAIRSGTSNMEEVEWSEASVQSMIQTLHQREVILVAESTSNSDEQAPQLAGWGIIKGYSDRQGYRIACETSLYVDFDSHGLGIGQSLIDAIFERCCQLDYHHAVAKIMAINRSSIRFHICNGFETVGIQKEIGKLNGRLHDVVILQKIFAV